MTNGHFVPRFGDFHYHLGVQLAQNERASLCDLFDKVGPDAPTLCEGWTTHDLAAHLWVRETDPIGAPGIVAKPFAGLTERRMAEVRQRWSYPELVERIRSGPSRFSVFALPGVDEAANAMEYFIHHEDVRRPNGATEPRPLDAQVEDWLWRRVGLLARAWFRRVEVGVVLERSDQPQSAVRASSGPHTVTIVGTPGELALYGHGRRDFADVQLIGTPEGIAALQGGDLSL